MNWKNFDIRYIGIAALVFLAALICLLGYLIDQIFHVFGPFFLIGGSVAIIAGELIFFYLPTEIKTDQDGNIEFNMNEMVRILGILLTGIVASSMFIYVNNSDLTINAQLSSIIYITLVSLFPVILKIFRILRDIQDYIIVNKSEGRVLYRDNEVKESFLLNEINEAIVDDKGGITLMFVSGKKHHIPTYQMNIGRIGTRKAVIEIQKEINKRRAGS